MEEQSAFDPVSVFVGITYGFLLALLLALLAGAVTFWWPQEPQGAATTTLALQGVALLFAGWRAAARAGGQGWLHGGSAGLGLASLLLLLAVLTSGLPELGDAVNRLGLGAAAGLLGGIFGVNLKV